jgi:hypothetical protein
MKSIYIAMLSTLFLISCNSNKSTESAGADKYYVKDNGAEWMKFDTASIARYDNRGDVLWDNIINNNYEKTTLDSEFFGPGINDLSYYFDDGEFVAITASQSDDNLATRLQFYLENDQLVLARLREWKKDPVNGTAGEILIYIKNGDPVYALERFASVTGDEIPAKLNDIELLPSERSKAALIADLDKYWPEIIRRVHEDISSK